MTFFRIVTASSALALSLDLFEAQASLLGEVLQATTYSAAVGLNFRPRSFFSQEKYLQESWVTSLGVNWKDCSPFGACLLRFGFEKPQGLPRNKGQIGIQTAENELFVEAGFENGSLVFVGASFVVIRRWSNSKVVVGDFISNESSELTWSESAIVPSVKGWIGLPLLPQKLEVSLGAQRFFTSSAPAVFQFGTELKFKL